MNSAFKQAVEGQRKHLSGAAYLIIQPLFLNVISLPVLACIIRSLGASGYGEWYTASTLINTLGFLTNLGLRMHFIRRVAQEHEAGQVALSEQIGIRLLLATAAAILGILACAILRYPLVVFECATVTAVGFTLATVQTTFSDLLQALGRLKTVATVNLIAGLVLTATSFVVARFGWGPVAIAGAYLLGPLVGMVTAYWYVRQLFPVEIHWHLGRFREILWQSRVLGMQSLVNSVGNQAETLLVPKLTGITSNGYLGAGTILSSRLSVVPDGLSTAFYPVMARNFKIGPAHLVRTALMYFVTSVGLCIPIAIFTMLLARPLSHILFTHNADICRQVMVITIWYLPINAIAAAIGYTLNACGREKAEFKAALISNICGVIIAATLVAKFGLIGACWSLLARNTLSVLLRIPPIIQLIFPMLRAHSSEEATPIPAPEPVSAPIESIH